MLEKLSADEIRIEHSKAVTALKSKEAAIKSLQEEVHAKNQAGQRMVEERDALQAQINVYAEWLQEKERQ